MPQHCVAGSDELLLDVRGGPSSGVEQRARRAEVDDQRYGVGHGHDGRRRRTGRPGQSQRAADQLVHHLVRHRRRGLEHRTFADGTTCGIGVLGVDRDLGVPRHDEHRATQHDKGPERRDLGVVEPDALVERPHRGQHRCRSGVGVVEHGDQTDDELGDPPAVREVPEVDDAGDDRPAVGARGGDEVVVGQVAVDRLQRQLVGDCRDAFPGGGRGPLDAPAQVPVLHPRQQLGHHLRGPPQVPLQPALEAGVGDAAQLQRHGSGGVPQLSDDGRGEVVPPRQRPALDVGEQADGVLRAVDAHRGGLGDRDRHREAGQAPRQQPQDVVLRGQGGRRPAGVRHLQHEAPAVVLEPEVAVLLAAELGQAAGRRCRTTVRAGGGRRRSRTGDAAVQRCDGPPTHHRGSRAPHRSRVGRGTSAGAGQVEHDRAEVEAGGGEGLRVRRGVGHPGRDVDLEEPRDSGRVDDQVRP